MSRLLHYEERGSGLPVVMLHPTPVDHHFWLPVAELLASGYRVLLPDLPGHGLSPISGADDRTVSMASMGSAVLDLMDSLGIDRAFWCGCSIGGYLLYELWRQAPDRMRALMICSAKPHPDTAEARHKREAAISLMQATGTGAFFEAMLATLVGEPAKRRDPEMTQRLRVMMERMTPQAVEAVQRALADRPDSLPTAATIRIPTAVLAATLDQASSPPEMKQLADAIPYSTFYLLREMGHYAPYEQPLLVGALLRRFLDIQTGAQTSERDG